MCEELNDEYPVISDDMINDIDDDALTKLERRHIIDKHLEDTKEIYRDSDARTVDIVNVNSFGELTDGREFKLGIPTTKYKTRLKFQKGDPKEEVNGFTKEMLVVTVIDLLNKQNEEAPCKENKEALLHLNKALAAMERRESRLRKNK